MLFLVSTQTGVGLCDRDVYIYDLSARGGGGPSISGCRKSLFSFSFPQKNNRADFTHVNSSNRRCPEIYRFFDSGQVPPPPEAEEHKLGFSLTLLLEVRLRKWRSSNNILTVGAAELTVISLQDPSDPIILMIVVVLKPGVNTLSPHIPCHYGNKFPKFSLSGEIRISCNHSLPP